MKIAHLSWSVPSGSTDRTIICLTPVSDACILNVSANGPFPHLIRYNGVITDFPGKRSLPGSTAHQN